MENIQRVAVYFAPEQGPLTGFMADWLGWCPLSGQRRSHPDIAGLPRPVHEITWTPRKYGPHGTLKPPFRLAGETDLTRLGNEIGALARRRAPLEMPGLALTRIGGFLALVPEGDTSALANLARDVVVTLDAHRAPPDPEELARRRAAGLTARQEALLTRWGYPYVMEEFRFHLTLTGKLAEAEARQVAKALDPVITPLLPRPFQVKDICLFGEDEDSMFHLIHRYPLTG